MGRGMRKKRTNVFPYDEDYDSSSGSDSKKLKKSKLKILAAPSPPPLLLINQSSQMKTLSIASIENSPQVTIVSNKKQGKTASKAPVTAASNKHKLLEKIKNLRQQAADKAQQRKKAMSLENVRKVAMRKKTVKNTLCSELSVKAFETDKSSKSKPQSSSIVSLNSQTVKNTSSSSHISEMSTDSRSPLPQSLCRSPDKIQNPCLSPTHSSNHSSKKTPPREFEYVATENRSETDTESDEQTPSQPALTSKVTTGTVSLFLVIRIELISINSSNINLKLKLYHKNVLYFLSLILLLI